MSDDGRKWAVDLYERDIYVTTVLLDALGKRVEMYATCAEFYDFTTLDTVNRRATARLLKRERR